MKAGRKPSPEPTAQDIYEKKLRQLHRLREHYNERFCRMRDYVERIDEQIEQYQKKPGEITYSPH